MQRTKANTTKLQLTAPMIEPRGPPHMQL